MRFKNWAIAIWQPCLQEPRRDETLLRRQGRLLAGDRRGPGKELRPRMSIARFRQHVEWIWLIGERRGHRGLG